MKPNVKVLWGLVVVLLAVGLSLVPSSTKADIWVAGDTRMAKVTTTGQIIVTLDSVFGRGFRYGVGPQDIIGVDRRNGHVWVSDVNNDRVFQLDGDGNPLREITLLSPFAIGIEPNSGAVWTSILLNEVTFPRAVIKLNPTTGAELVRVTGFSSFVAAIAVGISGQIWIADRFNNEVVVLFGTDEELDRYDASSSSGPHHFRLGGFDEPLDLDIGPRGNSEAGESTWVADRHPGAAVKIASDGTELIRVRPSGFFELTFVSVNSNDGSVWVGDPDSGRIAKLSALGQKLQNISVQIPPTLGASPSAVAVDVADDAVWIGSGSGAEALLVKRDSNGAVVLSITGLGSIRGIAAIVSPPAVVVIDGCDSGVPNVVLPSGDTISDLISGCGAGARNHGQFVSCITHVTNDLQNREAISGQQKGAIQSCAGQARIP